MTKPRSVPAGAQDPYDVSGRPPSFRIATTRRRATFGQAASTHYQDTVRLTHGSVAVGDPVRVEGSEPPLRGTVRSLWTRGGTPMQRIAERGPGGTTITIAISGFGDVPRGAVLVPAPVGTASPVQDAPPWGSATADARPTADGSPAWGPATAAATGDARLDDLFAAVQGLLKTVPPGGAHTTSSYTSSYQVTVNGQPVQDPAVTAQLLGPIVTSAGPDPAGVLHALREVGHLGLRAGHDYLAALPAPIPNTTSLDEGQVDALVDALRRAGAQVIAPGPNAPIRMQYRFNGGG